MMMVTVVSVLLMITPLVVHCTTIIKVNSHGAGLDDDGCISFPSLHSCATLQYALQECRLYDNVQIILDEGLHYVEGNDTITFKDMKRFELIGQPSEGSTTIQCEEMTGLSFVESSNIVISRVVISGCGSLQTSSSSDLDRTTINETHYIRTVIGISFILCTNVNLNDTTVQDSPGTGVVFYNTGGTNIIGSSNFLNNGAGNNVGGGGVRIEFLYCLPRDSHCSTDNGSSIPENNKHNVTFDFVDCTFTGNYDNGRLHPNGTNNAFISSYSNHHFVLGRGGGLGAVFKGDTHHVSVTIDSCYFSNNSAVWGGGAFIAFQGDVNDNTVVVKSTNFVNNYCPYDPCRYDGTGGGGVRVLYGGYDGIGSNNKLVFDQCNFTDNHAYFGGGVSVSIIPEDLSNVIEFNGTTWEGNVARLGAAVDLSIWNVFFGTTIPTTVFRDCTFLNNSIEYTSDVGTAIGTGTIYSDTVPVEFIGFIHCSGNKGSCIYSVEASVKFSINTTGTFNDNSAYNGGAIALFSNSYIMLSAGCGLEFIDNRASIHGGAVYWEGIGNRYLVSAQNCFIRYQDIVLDPSEWLVTLSFAGNTARVTGNDIFGTTLLGCVRNIRGSGVQQDIIEQEYNMIFNWSPTVWLYDNFTDNSIATAPSNFLSNGEINCGQPYHMTAVPGKLTQLSVRMRDDRNILYPVDSLVFSAIVNDSNDTAQYIASGELPFTGNEGEVKEYAIATLQPARVILSKVYLTLQRCPFGFRFDPVDLHCEGAGYPFIQTHTNFTSSIQRGYWIGLVGEETVVSQCFFCPFNKKLPPSNFILLPSDNETTEFFCGGLHRRGKLCQECEEGYGLAVSSERFSCVKCTEANFSSSWILYILGKYFLVTLILLLVIIFNISVTSGYANSFVVFAQLISTTFSVDTGQIINFSSITPSADFLRRLYISLYGLWNLDFFDSFNIIPHCFSTKVTVLHFWVLSYVTAIYPLLLLSIIVIILALYDRSNRVVVFFLKPLHRLLARWLQFLNLKRSIMDAFATFVVLSYAKFAAISAYLLYPSPLINADSKTVKYVSYFDHTKGYTSIEYAPYFISALLVMLIGFLLSVMLFLYSIKPFNRFLQEHRLSFLLPGEKTKYFLNSFYHCYKDGRDGGHDRRYFASLYFLIRFIFLYFYSLAQTWAIQLLMQQITLTAVIIVISIFQPYKNNFFNIIDVIMFGLLAVVNVFTLYQTYLDVADIPLSRSSYYMQILIIFLPMVYIISIIIYFSIYKYIRKITAKKIEERKRRKRLQAGNEPSLDDFSYGAFMTDVDAENRFVQVKYYGSIQPDGVYISNNSRDGSMPDSMTPPSSNEISVTNDEDKRKSTIADDVVIAKQTDILELWETSAESTH